MIDEQPLSVEGRKKLEAYRDEIWSFIGGTVHTLYVKGTKRQMDEIIEEILDPEVVDTSRILKLKGQHDALKLSVTIFEDTAANLEARIQAQLDLENQTQQNEE